MSQNNSQKETETKFNIALATLEAIRQLLNDCNYYSKISIINGYNTQALKIWEQTLWNVFLEIESKINNEKRKKIRNLLLSLRKIPNPKVKSKKNPIFGTQTSYINAKIFMKKWDTCRHIDSLMRIYANEKGMLNPDKEQEELDEPEFDW